MRGCSIMFSWEIRNYLKEHNYILNRQEFVHVVNQVDNPQVKDVKKVGEIFSMTVSDEEEPIIIGVK